MLRTIVTCSVSVLATLLIVAATKTVANTSVNQSVVPACPHPVYDVDGNMSPLFCVSDNPVALRYFATEGRHTFALGPDATPAQVVTAVEADFRRGGTNVTICSMYQLAAWRSHWAFPLPPMNQVDSDLHLGLPANWCPEPHFNVAGS